MKRFRALATFFWAGALAAPISVLLHELAHLLTARSLGFTDVQLHAFSVDYVVGSYPDINRATVTLAGLACTLLMTVLSGLIAVRRPTAAWIALTVAGPLRGWIWFPGIIGILMGKAQAMGGDEVDLAARTQLPLLPFALYSAFLVVFSLFALQKALQAHPVEHRRPFGSAVVLGVITGIIVYTQTAPRFLQGS